MNSSWLWLLVVLYLIVVVGIVYVFVIADPSESKAARFVSETIPRNAYALTRRCLGTRAMSGIEWVLDHFLILIYCTVVFGSWSVIFYYVYPWIDNSTHVSKNHKIIGYLVFGACVASWRLATSSSPGIITEENLHRYNHFPYDDILFVQGQTCPTTRILRPARSKFDRYKYHQNVPRFDHFCGWIQNTVGEENYRFFLLFLLVHWVMCIYGTIVLTWLFQGHVLEHGLHQATFFNRNTGEELVADKVIILQYLFYQFFAQVSVLTLMAVMAVALGLFCGYHVWLTSHNMTTNEQYKWSDVNRWYKRELKKYHDAVKRGEAVEETPSQPQIDDGDVTCAPSIGHSAPDSRRVAHPGPKPVNIYDRGFVENWKEVLFPIPLRSDRTYATKSKGI